MVSDYNNLNQNQENLVLHKSIVRIVDTSVVDIYIYRGERLSFVDNKRKKNYLITVSQVCMVS